MRKWLCLYVVVNKNLTTKKISLRKEEVVADKVLLSSAVGSFYRTESEIWAGWAVRVHELIVLFITTYLEYHLV